MYLRQSKQKRADGREITYLQLAENVWDATKGRSQAQIVFNCGRADDPEVIERLRRLAKSILRRCSPEEIVAPGRRTPARECSPEERAWWAGELRRSRSGRR